MKKVLPYLVMAAIGLSALNSPVRAEPTNVLVNTLEGKLNTQGLPKEIDLDSHYLYRTSQGLFYNRRFAYEGFHLIAQYIIKPIIEPSKDGTATTTIFAYPIAYCLEFPNTPKLTCYIDLRMDGINGNEQRKKEKPIDETKLETPMNDELLEKTNSGIKRSKLHRTILDQMKAKMMILTYFADNHDMY